MTALSSEIVKFEINSFVTDKNSGNALPTLPVGAERRLAARHKIELQASILLMAIKNTGSEEEEYLLMQGQLLNVSASGIGIVISHQELREMRRFTSNPALRLMVPLPLQSVQLEALPVRCQQLNNTEVIIGAQITNMSGRDRVIFMDFINRLNSIDLKDPDLQLK